MRIGGPNEPIRPNTAPTMGHGSDQTKGVSSQGMTSNTENMRLFATSQRPHDWDITDKASNPGANQIDAMRKAVLS